MEVERTQQEELWEEIFSRENLLKALGRVESNGGAPGVDGMTTEELADHLREHWPSIRVRLDAGVYEPSPVKRRMIPKPGGGERQLGIPTVLDRFIQQAMLQVLSEVFEPTFSDHSYGFRPKRSAQEAAQVARGYIEASNGWVVDIDLAKFFDTVHHDRLMARMKRTVTDKRVLRLVNAYLKAGVMVNGIVVETHEGTPQGGPLSPLLSNIVLTELDRKLEERGHHFVRYADDCNIYVGSRSAAERVLESTQRFIEGRMRLKVNEAKSAADLASKRQFLGFSFYWRAGGGVGLRLARRSLDRVKHKVRQMTGRNSGQSVETVIERANRYITGWVGYFHIADAKGHVQRLDEHLRRRLRQLVWKQWKTPANRYRNLRVLGVSEFWAIRAGGTSEGYWRLSASPPVQKAMDNAFWEEIGLVGFFKRYQAFRST